MSVPMIFKFKQTNPCTETSMAIRVVDIDGEPWFVAADICTALELNNTSMAVSGLDDDEKGISSVETRGGPQSATVISESGLYSLVLRSRKPEAKQFKRWITHDVLPAIRKTGSYGIALPDFSDPAAAARAWADEVDARRAAQFALEQAKPAVDFVAKYADAASGNKTFRQVCKLLGAKEHQFREFLIDRSVIYYLNGEMTPFAQHLDVGRFSVKTGVSNHSDHVYNRMTFTPKGVTWIAGEWGKHLAEMNQQAMQQRPAQALSHAHH
ncbi:BRO family protein [Paraburkholderia terricola]|uniref:BRO family protein n=1 Tax=Paraburkholderia terricola TaxID=169427 RepID=UPI003ED0363B